jgi:hypothetical protein
MDRTCSTPLESKTERLMHVSSRQNGKMMGEETLRNKSWNYKLMC